MLDGMSDYTTINDRKSPLEGSRPSVPTGLIFLQAGCPYCRPNNSVEALKGKNLMHYIQSINQSVYWFKKGPWGTDNCPKYIKT